MLKKLKSLFSPIEVEKDLINARHYSSNLRELNSYIEMDIKKYMYIATLDIRTCEKCGYLDRKIFKVSDAIMGVNFPPLHDDCRCSTRAHFNFGKRKGAMRRARNPHTGKSELIPAVMNYKQWKKKHNI